MSTYVRPSNGAPLLRIDDLVQADNGECGFIKQFRRVEGRDEALLMMSGFERGWYDCRRLRIVNL